MAKKKDKALQSLKKDVARLQEQNDKLAETLENTREEQASAHKELRTLLEERLTVQEAGPGEKEVDLHGGEEELVVTEAAQRRAEELGIDLSDVEGSGSDGRVLVKDVEAAEAAK
jgi:pyruvate/2-oxoglutarate dehydrogenase complex dihydrolipoamide acyltransferase (E2) component